MKKEHIIILVITVLLFLSVGIGIWQFRKSVKLQVDYYTIQEQRERLQRENDSIQKQINSLSVEIKVLQKSSDSLSLLSNRIDTVLINIDESQTHEVTTYTNADLNDRIGKFSGLIAQ